MKIVCQLVDAGANLGKADSTGSTPLHYVTGSPSQKYIIQNGGFLCSLTLGSNDTFDDGLHLRCKNHYKYRFVSLAGHFLARNMSVHFQQMKEDIVMLLEDGYHAWNEEGYADLILVYKTLRKEHSLDTDEDFIHFMQHVQDYEELSDNVKCIPFVVGYLDTINKFINAGEFDFLRTILTWPNHPMTLKAQVRFLIRVILLCRNQWKLRLRVHSLPLPTMLLKYLMYDTL